MLLHAGVLQNQQQQMGSFRWNSPTFPAGTPVGSPLFPRIYAAFLLNPPVAYPSTLASSLSPEFTLFYLTPPGFGGFLEVLRRGRKMIDCALPGLDLMIEGVFAG